ncbi:hypothetical protein AN619_14860 [Thermotalea metallivorans]|uniref:Uncharacterized protein n=2 Tax=Thermotalea metallivorans TaxID=520762 RepID=A0A140L5A7_9FIRM|nr:hypothetical protein AN619_14860 [Thermotalea metallivorans]
MLVFNSSHMDALTKIMIEHFHGVVADIDSAFEISGEDDTIVFLTDPGKKKAELSDVKSTIVVPLPSDDLFSALINIKATQYIEDSHISPGLLIMRTVGDHEKIIESVCETYHGQILSFSECLNRGTSNQTIISFTNQPVNRKLSLKDIHPKHVLVDMDVHKLYRKMRSQVLRFFNEGFQDKNWYDLEIRIYDRYSQYMNHYERLSFVLDVLDVGLILGESWGKDHPRFLMSVMVYQIRLFTLLDPIEIKRILIGLEHLEDGTRIIDLDLIYKGNKIEWPRAIEKNNTAKSRNELGKTYRGEILKKLDKEEKALLQEMEKKILKSRY